MTDRTIAALIPPRLSPGSAAPEDRSATAPLPLAELLPRLRGKSLRYGMAQIDSAGRVSNRVTVTTLGWADGDRLQIAVVSGSVVVVRDPSGPFAMGRKPYIVLPAAVRHRVGVGPGDQVLIAADPNHDVLVVHPLAAVDSMIAAYHASLARGDDCDR